MQGSDSNHTANTTIAAGLPNITGYFSTEAQNEDATGAFYCSWTKWGAHSGSGGAWQKNVQFNASRSSSIYGKSTTVQPPAYVVNIWRRTA